MNVLHWVPRNSLHLVCMVRERVLHRLARHVPYLVDAHTKSKNRECNELFEDSDDDGGKKLRASCQRGVNTTMSDYLI